MFKEYHTNRKNQEKKKTSTKDGISYCISNNKKKTSHGDHCAYTCKNPRVHSRKYRKRRSFQEWSKFKAPSPVVRTVKELVGLFKSYTPYALQVLDYLIWCDSRGIPLFMGQKHIGNVKGMCRQTVNRHIQRFYNDGLLDIYTRPNGSNIYKLSSIFRNKDVQKKLFKLLPVLCSLFLSLLSAYSITSPFPDHFFYGSKTPSRAIGSIIQSTKETLYKRQVFNFINNKEEIRNNSQKGEEFIHNLLSQVKKKEKVMYQAPKRIPQERIYSNNKEYYDSKPSQFDREQAELRRNIYINETDRIVKEADVRQKVLEIERGTEYEKNNNEKGNAILERALGLKLD